uniref:G-protein coupled receptors family 1 profile domain-containing protein n=1 Tax=Gopherus evgoodei TaxID=1825980 RepID=A0A8C4YT20_9SAUR
MKPTANKCQGNQTTVTEFILLGFGDLPGLHVLLFLLFLVIYIVTMAGNILIVVLVVTDQHLHTPMYFFLGNLSCLETSYTSTMLPRMLDSLLTGNRNISVPSCIIQLYFFGSLAGTECCLLSVMSYDRYLAICKPLHYAALMNDRLCLQLAVASWIGGFVSVAFLISVMSLLTFCGPNEIDHFFSDFSPIMKLSCSDTYWLEVSAVIHSSLFTFPPFLLTLASYVSIITTILRIPSTTGRQKAFSTCSSHLIVVTIFYGTLIIVYLLSDSDALRVLNKVCSVFYGVLTPLVNPLIYRIPVGTVQTTWLFSFPFCGPTEINHFFCDSPPVLKLVCGDTYLFEMYAVTGTIVIVLFPFIFILVSYICIISTILRIPSAEGRLKTFSTCSSHLMVVTLFYSTAGLTYFRPKSSYSPDTKKLLSLSYTVFTPMLNPIIYSLRNKEVKGAIRKMLGWQICSRQF